MLAEILDRSQAAMAKSDLITAWMCGMRANEDRHLLTLIADGCEKAGDVPWHTVTYKGRFNQSRIELDNGLPFGKSPFDIVRARLASFLLAHRARNLADQFVIRHWRLCWHICVNLNKV
jgi:hypothetical protein